MPVPVIDLFAGPGGLGEGFASLVEQKSQAFFEIGLSIEKCPIAHRTLRLRSVFRRLCGTHGIKHYYRYIRGEIDEDTFRRIPDVASAFAHAENEARCLELGKSDEKIIDSEIIKALKGQETWILIGGPPCQAYSLAGRSRRAKDKDFHKDEKHFLYKEYLRIIQVHKPTIFVMENVKGLLSSTHSGNPMFEKIIADLSKPADGLEYEIRSFVKNGSGESLAPTDYIIHSERYGIPQNRHRVILFGVKKSLNLPQHDLLTTTLHQVTVNDAIGDLPKIRSRLSSGDSLDAWRQAVQDASKYLSGVRNENESFLRQAMRSYSADARHISCGGRFVPMECKSEKQPTELKKWINDPMLGGVCQHESRSHMASDLARYLFSACYAVTKGCSPSLDLFPTKLLPNHKNVSKSIQSEKIPFNDRFRVQCRQEPASTIVAHIAKDGHYYIHYDPSQCRSLTVRESARLQTFPDNYYFAGNRTEQYTQVGNAVPPLLAYKLARIIKNLLSCVNKTARLGAGCVVSSSLTSEYRRHSLEVDSVAVSIEVD